MRNVFFKMKIKNYFPGQNWIWPRCSYSYSAVQVRVLHFDVYMVAWQAGLKHYTAPF
jgi:hypothetical protein